MDTNLDIKDQKELQEVAQNLEGVAFSGGQELGAAVREVVPSKKGFLATLKKLFKRNTNSPSELNK
jgi:hypothetical protein